MSKTYEELIQERKAAIETQIKSVQEEIDGLNEQLSPLKDKLRELNKQISDLDDPAKILERAFGSTSSSTGGSGGGGSVADRKEEIVAWICEQDEPVSAKEIKTALNVSKGEWTKAKISGDSRINIEGNKAAAKYSKA